MTEYKNSIPMDEAFNQVFNNEEDLKEYLSYAFEQYIEDGKNKNSNNQPMKSKLFHILHILLRIS